MESSKIVTNFPCQFRQVEIEFIPLADGTRLSARYWIPKDADENPVPAILEYIPYCTRDGTAARDEAMHPFFAGHGYAAIRVDMRGSGESDGVLLDEYLKQEQDDALEVIAWIAEQPWCNGKVGMMGKSWGGFNGLQVAARRPPALKCIISVYSTDDRYADDIHYMGGCLINNNPGWAFVMFGGNARPPDPALVGERWRDMWMQRLNANRPWIIDWLKHQTRDEFWKHGSVCEDYSAIDIPVYAMGGWADGYSNPVPRLLAGLSAPCKALIGPWGHQYMHQAKPSPMMGYMSEALRWWDHWLKDEDTGIMDEPRYRVWLQDSIEPRTFYDTRPGRWIAEDSWPSSRNTQRDYVLNTKGLASSAEPSRRLTLKCPMDTGLCSPAWINHGDVEPTEPGDQRPDDMRSLAFDSQPLDTPLEIFGAPTVTLELDSDQPVALIAARLCDVAADGASTRVTYGLLNLTHRNGHETAEPLKPGEKYTVTVQLNDIAHRFKAGHRIRIALSTAHWPIVWPSPAVVTLGIHTGVSVLSLPQRPHRDGDEQLRALPPPEHTAPHPTTRIRPGRAFTTTVEHNIATDEVVVRDESDSGRVRFDRHGWEFSKSSKTERRIAGGDPLSARTRLSGQLEFGRAGQIDTRVEVFCDVWSDASHFHVKATLDAFEDDRPVFSKTWLEAIPRNGV